MREPFRERRLHQRRPSTRNVQNHLRRSHFRAQNEMRSWPPKKSRFVQSNSINRISNYMNSFERKTHFQKVGKNSLKFHCPIVLITVLESRPSFYSAVAAYYKHVPCFNKIGKKLGDCMRAMSSVLEASATQAPLTNRVPYTCWYVHLRLHNTFTFHKRIEHYLIAV